MLKSIENPIYYRIFDYWFVKFTENKYLLFLNSFLWSNINHFFCTPSLCLIIVRINYLLPSRTIYYIVCNVHLWRPPGSRKILASDWSDFWSRDRNTGIWLVIFSLGDLASVHQWRQRQILTEQKTQFMRPIRHVSRDHRIPREDQIPSGPLPPPPLVAVTTVSPVSAC